MHPRRVQRDGVQQRLARPGSSLRSGSPAAGTARRPTRRPGCRQSTASCAGACASAASDAIPMPPPVSTTEALPRAAWTSTTPGHQARGDGLREVLGVAVDDDLGDAHCLARHACDPRRRVRLARRPRRAVPPMPETRPMTSPYTSSGSSRRSSSAMHLRGLPAAQRHLPLRLTGSHQPRHPSVGTGRPRSAPSVQSSRTPVMPGPPESSLRRPCTPSRHVPARRRAARRSATRLAGDDAAGDRLGTAGRARPPAGCATG